MTPFPVFNRMLALQTVSNGYIAILCLLLSLPVERSMAATRAQGGLQAIYDFSSTTGAIVKDRSGVGAPVDLRITAPEAVRRSKGTLEVFGKTIIRSDKPPSRIIEMVRRSGELTIEAWIRPANTSQKGPARIVTLSRSGTERNFTLGQDGDKYDVRFRTSTTSANGIPSLTAESRSATVELTHVVYTRDRTGKAKIYINGKKTSEKIVSGSTFNWHGQFHLAFADELGGRRQWLGTYHLVAIYSRNLLAREVEQNFNAGANPQLTPQLARKNISLDEQLFHSKIAPLLAKRCLDCHDSSTRKGKLDLSRKDSARAGGGSGVAIVPGNSGESLLWETVNNDEMPEDGPFLSAKEKKYLKQWIDSGAVWPTDVIDPATYAHESGADENWLRRLTVSEYIETVRTAVGIDVEKTAREILPPDVRADGFSNTAYNLNVDLKHVNAYARLSEIIVGRMDVLKFARRFSKSRKVNDKDNRALIEKMGIWLLRGRLEEHEIVTYRGISTTVVSAGGDFEEATSYVIEAMLQSPRFIYRIENQKGDGTAWPVDAYELASRMSYIIWGAPPDKELMRMAKAGELYDADSVEVQMKRMLKDPRAIERSSQFIAEWLNLGRLKNLRPDKKKFPMWNTQLATDMRDETLAFFKEVAWNQKRPLADLLNAQVTYATPRLAKHYGLEPVGDADKLNLLKYDLSSEPGRGGLLTHGSVLTVGGDEASMVSRGLLVLHDFLRGVVKDPPPCVDTTPVPTKAGLTQRGIAEGRIANKACGGCHSKFEPLAFGLEKFDGLGTYRELDEHGNTLRDDGQILFPGAAKSVAYKSSAELMNLLAGSERLRKSITWKVTQFALGRPLGAMDAPILDRIHNNAQKNGGTYVSLITAIVMSDLVQTTRTETDK